MKPQDIFENTLNQYRQSIDAIDEELIALLKKRCTIVNNVGKLKQEHRIQGSFIRPGREAIMLRDIVEMANGEALSSEAIVAIWRIIIGSSTALESPLNTITLEQDVDAPSIALQYFGPDVPHNIVSNDALIDRLTTNPHSIAVVPFDRSAAWWKHIVTPLHVFACLPFIGQAPTHLAIGHVTPEPTGNDVSVIYDHTKHSIEIVDGFAHSEKEVETDINSFTLLGSYAKAI